MGSVRNVEAIRGREWNKMWVNFSFVRTRQCRQAIKLDKQANEDEVSNGIFHQRSKKN